LVERRLKVRRGRRFHAIAGFSLGGYGAAFYASQRPGYFGIAAALSARLSLRNPLLHIPGQLDYALGDPLRQRFYWTGHDPLALVRNLRWTRMYVSAGDGRALPGEPSGPANEIGENNLRRFSERFVRAARRAHVPVTFRIKGRLAQLRPRLAIVRGRVPLDRRRSRATVTRPAGEVELQHRRAAKQCIRLSLLLRQAADAAGLVLA
jgi:Putative esterase